MEFREYIAIFRKHSGMFWLSVIIFVAGAFLWQGNQPERYQATLLLNIGRIGTEETADYTFDSFYRLQADERFADTVVRWLGSPRVVEDIYVAAGLEPSTIGIRDLKSAFSAKRLSSQMIEVGFSGADRETLEKISTASIVVLNRYAESLNRDDRSESWFMVIGDDPVIRDARVGLASALVIALVFGIFIGFWMAFVRHYFSSQE